MADVKPSDLIGPGLGMLGGLVGGQMSAGRERADYRHNRDSYNRHGKETQAANTRNWERRRDAVQQYNQNMPTMNGALSSLGLDFSIPEPVYQELAPQAPYQEQSSPGFAERLMGMISGAGAGMNQNSLNADLQAQIDQLGQSSGGPSADPSGGMDPAQILGMIAGLPIG